MVAVGAAVVAMAAVAVDVAVEATVRMLLPQLQQSLRGLVAKSAVGVRAVVVPLR